MPGTGFYKMHRGWMENPAFRNQKFSRAQAWCWLIEQAVWQDCSVGVKGRTLDLTRGQLTYSTRYLADAWRWPETVVRLFLNRLKTDAMIRAATGAGQTIITICNYETYQCSSDEPRAPIRAPIRAEAAQEPRSTRANKKKVIKKEGKKTPSTGAPSGTCKQMVVAYNVMARSAGIPVVKFVSKKRQQDLLTRFNKECRGDIEVWFQALKIVNDNGFFHGDNDKGWRADLTFMLQPKSFTRIIEGAYDFKKPKKRQHHVSEAII